MYKKLYHYIINSAHYCENLIVLLIIIIFNDLIYLYFCDLFLLFVLLSINIYVTSNINLI